MSSMLQDELAQGDAREREESWRYSKAAWRALGQQNFVPLPAASTQSCALPELLVQRFSWPQTRAQRIVFIDGVFDAALSDVSGLGAQLHVAHGAASTLELSLRPFGSPALLHIVYVNSSAGTATRWQAAAVIEIKSGQTHIIEHHVGDSGADVLGTTASKILIGVGAQLSLTALVDLPDCVSLYRRAQVAVADDALLRTTQAIFGGKVQRLDFDVDLSGARARCESRGVFALHGREHADTHLRVRHIARDTACDVLWRGVCDARSRGIFHGAMIVEQGADGSDARLSSKNLLLSPHAEIDTQPVLEIYADEVKAAHGATVGQIDEQLLFYLRARGIPLIEARALLVSAFCNVVLDATDGTFLREYLQQRLEAVLPAQF